jgi:concanavalin A-like lectin/glucanase superfamily protein
MDHLQFDGITAYAEVPDSTDLSVATTGSLSVSAAIRPDTLSFRSVEGTRYVHWMGKGETGHQEWVLRMYSQGNTEGRENRISFYVFNPAGGRGVGAYVQEPVRPGDWIHVVGVADGTDIHLYKDGVLKNSQHYGSTITPTHGSAPLRFGTRDFRSFFQGAVAQVRIWNRALTAAEVGGLFAGNRVPHQGLVGEWLFMVGHDTSRNHNAIVRGAAWGTDDLS